MRPKILPLLELSSLHAKAAILMDGDNQRVLFGKEEEKELPMASTTKIMTCLYAIEHGNLSDKVTFREGRLLLLKYGLVPEAVHNFYCPICSMH